MGLRHEDKVLLLLDGDLPPRDAPLERLVEGGDQVVLIGPGSQEVVGVSCPLQYPDLAAEELEREDGGPGIPAAALRDPLKLLERSLEDADIIKEATQSAQLLKKVDPLLGDGEEKVGVQEDMVH